MKRFTKLLAIIAAIAVIISTMSISVFAEDANVKIDMSKTYQTIDGFGASYTWYGDWLTTNVNAEQGYDWIFNDCEFNILRFRDLNRVGSDENDGEYQNALNGYKAYKSYYDAAVARGIDPIVLVTSWGQYNRNLGFVAFTELDDEGHTYYTLAKDENGEYMYDELADFCVESIKLFFDAGIPVDYFSISNETELQGLGKDENGNARSEAGFYFGAEENEYHCAYWKAHIAVYNAFKEAFGEWAPNITGAEVMADTADLITKYVSPLEENAPETFDTIAHHLYGSENSPRSFKQVGDRYYGKYTLWQTEYYMDEYIRQAEMMANEFLYENVNAYLYWNGVWVADLGNCLIEIENDNSGAIERKGNHYIMMHFSKYIKRGYQRVDVENTSGATVVAFKAPDSHRLVIVAVNNKDSYEDLYVDIGGAAPTSSSVYQTVGSENRFKYKYWQEAGQFNTDGSNELPPLSVTTFVIELPADPTYVPPVEDTAVNPFLKQPKAGLGMNTGLLIGIIAGAVVVIVIIVTAVAASGKKKKASAQNK